MFPAARIHSFEANPIFFPVLERVAETLRGRCQCIGSAWGERWRAHALRPMGRRHAVLEESSTVLDYYEKPWVAQKFAERGGLTAAADRGDPAR